MPIPIVLVTRKELLVIRVNAAAQSLLRGQNEEVAVRPVAEFFYKEQAEYQAWYAGIQANGTNIPEISLFLKDQQTIVKVYTTCVDFAGSTHLLLTLVDITATCCQIGQLEQLAAKDDMTGLLNRRTFRASLEMALQNLQQEKSVFFLAFMDLNELKKVNDTYGHREGDWYISMFTSLLLGTLRTTDIAGRIGGDEFAVIFSQCSQPYAEQVIYRLQQQLNALSASVKKPYSMGVSTGLVMVESGMEIGVDALLNIADKAMYHKKYYQNTQKNALLEKAEKFGIKNTGGFW